MALFAEYKEEYEKNWAELEIRSSRLQDARNQANRLLRGKPTYQHIGSKTGVPWWFVGLCHYRESSFNFDTYLGNGQSLGRVTTIVPKGRGPFTGPDAFTNGAIDALRLEGFIGANDWGVARTLHRLEGFNGYGYHGKGVNSPYLYGGSTIYGPPEAKGGKYVADHMFNASVVDSQLGTAVILKALMQLDSSIDLGGTATDRSSAHPGSQEPDDELTQSIRWLQASLNKLGANPPLEEDGKNGPKTMAAVSRFQLQNGLADTGLSDAATIAAIGQQLSSPPVNGQTPSDLAPAHGQSPGDLAPARGRAPTNLAPAHGQASGDLVVAIKQLIDHLQKGEGISISPPANDLTNTLQQVANILQKLNINIGPTSVTPIALPPPQDQAAQLQKILDFVSGLINPSGTPPPLGQVDGALGETIGNMLNGKKAAIGAIGSLLTAWLSNVPALPAGTTPSGLLGLIQLIAGSVPGLSGFTMPLFLALTAWGVLGKLEKWAQGTAPPPTSAK
jgi:lysozyme family protein/peptidoglycan hydrolase-like protein with peptidoglycan-binding domain